MNERDLDIVWTKGKGPGGQNKNKLETCCNLTHRPTGITVRVDGRKRNQNLKKAKKILERRLRQRRQDELAADRKAKREKAIRSTDRVRTYDYSRDTVTDHRTGKTSTIKEILVKGNLDKLK